MFTGCPLLRESGRQDVCVFVPIAGQFPNHRVSRLVVSFKGGGTAERHSLLPLLPFFLVAIVMVGFPVITSLTFNGKDLTLTLDKDIVAVQQHPTNASARDKLVSTLAATTKAAEASGKPGVAAESIARANLQLNNPQAAVKWAALAVKMKPGDDAARSLLMEAQQR